MFIVNTSAFSLKIIFHYLYLIFVMNTNNLLRFIKSLGNNLSHYYTYIEHVHMCVCICICIIFIRL